MAQDPRDPAAELFSAEDPGILGIDNVRLELPVAGVGSRLLAISLDQIAILIAAMLWMVLCLALGALLMSSTGSGMVVVWVVMAVGAFLIDFTYYSVCEIKMGGRTPGKSVLGLRTVNSLGGEASPAAILVRNALRIFDYLVGTLMVLLDPRRRRLGDLVASTLVIHDPQPTDDGEARVGHWPAGFTIREIALTEQLLRRIPRLLPERARELAALYLKGLHERDPAFYAAAPGEAQADPVFELWRVLQVRTGEPGPA